MVVPVLTRWVIWFGTHQSSESLNYMIPISENYTNAFSKMRDYRVYIDHRLNITIFRIKVFGDG